MKDTHYILDIPTSEEAEFIDDALTAFNAAQAPFTQSDPFVPFRYCARDGNGALLGGILAYAVCWHILYIDTLWVREDERRKGLGGALLAAVEKDARAMGCHLAHLSTFDFQGKSFYLRHGYTIFGMLSDSPPGHQELFMTKRLDTHAD